MTKGWLLFFSASILGIFLLSSFMTGTASGVDIGDPADQQVFLYEHTNYGGANMSFSVGTRVSDLRQWRLPNSKKNWNDVISSIKVGKRARIILYKHINFEHELTTIDADCQNIKYFSNLHSYGWGDDISSFEIKDAKCALK